MNILISAGHTLEGKGLGAVSYINESEENRALSKIVIEYLKLSGHNVDYHEVNKSNNHVSEQIAYANSKNYDLVVQIHFNAHKKTDDSMGTETLYASNNGKVFAKRVNDKLATVFKDRGAKFRSDLSWLSKTKAPSILVETCFVDSKLDTDTYKVNKDLVGKLIAEGIHGKDIKVTNEETTGIYYRVVAGSYSKKENAEAQMELLKSKGINGVFIDVYKKWCKCYNVIRDKRFAYQQFT